MVTLTFPAEMADTMRELVFRPGTPEQKQLRASALGRLLAITSDDIEGRVARMQHDAAQAALGSDLFESFRQGWHLGAQDVRTAQR